MPGCDGERDRACERERERTSQRGGARTGVREIAYVTERKSAPERESART